MARILGVDLPNNKRVEIGLTAIYGIGRPTAERIVAECEIDPATRVKDLTDADLTKIRDCIDKHCIVEGDLRRQTNMNIKNLVEIGCYRGRRHKANLPVRGQRTRTNARTRKGPKRTVAGKKEA